MIDLQKLNELVKSIDLTNCENNNLYRLPIENEKIYFIEDVWVFKNIHKESVGEKEYDFKKVAMPFRNIAKLIMIKWLVSNRKFTSLDKYFGILYSITNFLYDNGVVQCEYIPYTVIEGYSENIERTLKSQNEIIKRKKIFIQLLEYLEYAYKMGYRREKCMLDSVDTNFLRAQMEENKTPTIPKEVFNKTIKYALCEMKDENSKIEHRIQAAIVLFLSQVGMRISDLTLIEFDKKEFVECFEETVPVAYLNYRTFKGSRKHNGRWTKTFLTDKAELAYDMLTELSLYKGTRYVISQNGLMTKDSDKTRKLIYEFFIRNSRLIGLVDKEYEGLEKLPKKRIVTRGLISRFDLEMIKDIDYISMVKPHQFRVAVCNELIKDGVDIAWIAQHMEHLVEESTDYYIRQEKEEKKYAKTTIKQVVNGEYKLIGDNADQIMIKIEEFLSKDNIKVYKDLDDAIDNLVEVVPIREKKGGFCIKNSFGNKCKYDEFLCALDECPNHFTAYIFSDISYRRYKDAIKIIKYNEDNGFDKQAKLERDKLSRHIRRRFSKELKELKNEIYTKGIDVIVSKYPKLEYIANNIEEISKEVELWM